MRCRCPAAFARGTSYGIVPRCLPPRVTRLPLSSQLWPPSALRPPIASALRCNDRHAGLGAGCHQDASPRSQGWSCNRDHRARLDRGWQDRAQRRLGRPHVVGLAMGRARGQPRRCSRVPSLVEYARRRHGTWPIADPGHRGPQGQKLAIAGGPLDKSWLLLQALARRSGVDLRKQATARSAPASAMPGDGAKSVAIGSPCIRDRVFSLRRCAKRLVSTQYDREAPCARRRAGACPALVPWDRWDRAHVSLAIPRERKAAHDLAAIG